ncbi:MAG: hypothetical protein QOG63_707, partial [Thermoleophilaceae bacterium]|nr:hypothetical protein [Thermoleophilaceae bacterium]
MRVRSQGLRSFFGRSGVVVRAGPAVLGLRLTGYGYGTRLEPVGSVRPQARGNRVVYRRPGLTESYVGEPGGIEQRFSLAAAPATRASGPLSLALSLSGTAHPASSARGVTFVHRGASLTYRGLAVTDAAGRRLPARIKLGHRKLILAIDDSGARYPLHVDPTIASPTSSPYPQAVLADHPTAYYRLDDSGTQTVADSSGHGLDGTSVTGTGLGAQGALLSDSDTAVTSAAQGVIFNQSGDQLPNAATARTLEAWVDYGCCNNAFDLIRYGDVAGGHGFEIAIGDAGATIGVTAGAASVSAPTIGD